MHTSAYYAAFTLTALLLPHCSAAALTAHSPICFKHLDPMRPNSRVEVPCQDTVTRKRPSTELDYSASPGKFELIFSCIPPESSTCDKAKDSFQKAFTILESHLILNTNIVVNATFFNFCTTRGQCGSDGYQILGGAAPANSMQVEGLDGESRMYPQALLKQLDLQSHPRFEEIDIFCEFNAAAEFHFPSDTTPTSSTQSDMLFVVLHELIHGLGFTSSWDDYINPQAQFLTPGITGATDNSGQFQFQGFVENIFDKFMIEAATGEPMSKRTAALNSLLVDPSKIYQSQESFFSTLQTSPAATALTAGALNLGTTPKSLIFRPTNGPPMILETSLTPYVTGSSISHADLKTYTDTADFLMRFRVDSGVSLNSAIESGGGGPIGPVLLSVLQSLGYATIDNPNPFPTARTQSSASRILPLSLVPYAVVYASMAYSCLPFSR